MNCHPPIRTIANQNPIVETLFVILMICLILFGFLWHDESSRPR
jgi:hypothetical protein